MKINKVNNGDVSVLRTIMGLLYVASAMIREYMELVIIVWIVTGIVFMERREMIGKESIDVLITVGYPVLIQTSVIVYNILILLRWIRIELLCESNFLELESFSTIFLRTASSTLFLGINLFIGTPERFYAFNKMVAFLFVVMSFCMGFMQFKVKNRSRIGIAKIERSALQKIERKEL